MINIEPDMCVYNFTTMDISMKAKLILEKKQFNCISILKKSLIKNPIYGGSMC